MSEPVPEPEARPSRAPLQQRVAQTILAAAATLLAREGEHSSMNDVAVAAGVARATVYRYFPSRGQLLDSLADVAVDEATSRLAASRIHEVRPDEGIVRAVRALVDTGDAFVVLARRSSGRHRSEMERGVTRPLRALLDRAQRKNVVRDDIPSAWLAESLVALVVSVVPWAPTLGREDTIAAISTLFLDGARAAPRPAS